MVNTDFKVKFLNIIDLTHEVRAYQLAKPVEYILMTRFRD